MSGREDSLSKYIYRESMIPSMIIPDSETDKEGDN